MKGASFPGFVAAGFLVAGVLRADPIISFGKNGIGVQTDPPTTIAIALTYSDAPDPIDPTNGKTPLIYLFGGEEFGVPALTAGDILITDPATDQDEDLLRWEQERTASETEWLVVVYSQPGPALADVGLPTAYQTNLVTMPEEIESGGGEEGIGLFNYQPSAGQPGYVEGSDYTYNFTDSVLVPEPGAVPIVGMIWFGLRRKRK